MLTMLKDRFPSDTGCENLRDLAHALERVLHAPSSIATVATKRSISCIGRHLYVWKSIWLMIAMIHDVGRGGKVLGLTTFSVRGP